jgi:hypothetical protein
VFILPPGFLIVGFGSDVGVVGLSLGLGLSSLTAFGGFGFGLGEVGSVVGRVGVGLSSNIVC